MVRIAAIALGITLVLSPVHAQALKPRIDPNQSPACWEINAGIGHFGIQCANGFWQTVTPDGTVYQGNGTFDPNADAQGSTIQINPATGGPTGFVAPPPSQLPLLAPYQGPAYGFPLPE